MKPNPGHLPPEAIGKRVRVVLENGLRVDGVDHPEAKPGWPADGPQGCRWQRTGNPWDIASYEVVT